MDGERAAKIIAQSARENVQRAVSDLMQLVRTGKGREFRHPFTGKTEELGSTNAKVMAKQLISCGLAGNDDFMRAFENVLQEVATGPIWSFFTAYDGEGAFVEDLWVELSTDTGDKVPHYLHEIMSSVDEDEDQS